MSTQALMPKAALATAVLLLLPIHRSLKRYLLCHLSTSRSVKYLSRCELFLTAITISVQFQLCLFIGKLILGFTVFIFFLNCFLSKIIFHY